MTDRTVPGRISRLSNRSRRSEPDLTESSSLAGLNRKTPHADRRHQKHRKLRASPTGLKPTEPRTMSKEKPLNAGSRA